MKRKIIILITLIIVLILTQHIPVINRNKTGLSINVTDIDTSTTDNIEIYYTRTQADFDRLTDILENRNGKIIIEVSEGVVLDADGNGADSLGNYIKYGNNFSIGDIVKSVFVYNPENNAIDDILYRYDFLTE